MRFFYYYPSWDKPSGGNKQLRLQATLLGELGVETFLLRDKAFLTRPASFDDNVFYSVPIPHAPVSFERACDFLSPNDVLVLPEVRLDDWLAVCGGWRCRIAVNNQNGFYGLRYCPPKGVVSNRIEFAIANAPYVAALCRRFYGLPPERIFHVPHWVVRSPFEPTMSATLGEHGVCYMPRKLPNVVRQVKERVERERPGVPWIEIDGVPETEVSQLMRSRRVFFAAQDLEGCPLTALEAMTCGAIVAGFPGTGRFPHPYAKPENGFWVEDRDMVAAVTAVIKAIDLTAMQGNQYQRFVEAGYATAQRFSRIAVETALAELVSTVQNRSYSSRTGPRPRLGRLGWFQAFRTLHDANRLGWPSRVVSVAARVIRRLLPSQHRDHRALRSANDV